jgi:hypothetical protein
VLADEATPVADVSRAEAERRLAEAEAALAEVTAADTPERRDLAMGRVQSAARHARGGRGGLTAPAALRFCGGAATRPASLPEPPDSRPRALNRRRRGRRYRRARVPRARQTREVEAPDEALAHRAGGWDRFDPAKLNPEVVPLVKAAAMVERNGDDYAVYLKRVFSDDPDFQRASDAWAEEEVQHGDALGRWAMLADPAWDYRRRVRPLPRGLQDQHGGGRLHPRQPHRAS